MTQPPPRPPQGQPPYRPQGQPPGAPGQRPPQAPPGYLPPGAQPPPPAGSYGPPGPWPGAYGPVPAGPPSPPGGWGYGYAPAPAGARPPVKHTSHTKLIAFFVVGLIVVAGAFLLISNLATPGKKTQKCPPDCPKPPVGPAVVAGLTYTGPGGSFSFTYPRPNRIYDNAQKVTNGVVVPLKVSDGGAVLLQGNSAGGKSAQQVVAAYLHAKFPDAHQAYVIPNAIVGYQAGYGEVDDVYEQTSNGAYAHERVVALAAVKNDTAVLAVGLGAYRVWTPDGLTDGHPSGVATVVAIVMDPMINSFKWKGDPTR